MPWGHAGVGYLLYLWYAFRVREFDPHGPALAALLVGTQFPDLVDKPLAWTFAVLPSGRSLAHSLLVAAVVVAVVSAATERVGRRYLGTAFAVGYLSHLAADSVLPAARGRTSLLTNLGWPLLPPPAFDESGGFEAHLTVPDPTPFFWLQASLLTAGALLFAYVERSGVRSRFSADGPRSNDPSEGDEQSGLR